MSRRNKHKNKSRARARRKLRRLGLLTVCSACESIEYLEVHHKNGNVYNNALTNLQVLCYKCHGRVHGKHSRNVREPFSRKVKKEAKALRLAAVPRIDFNVVVNEMEQHGWKFCRLSSKLNFFHREDNKNLIIDVKYVMVYIKSNGMDGLEEYCEGKAEVWGFINIYEGIDNDDTGVIECVWRVCE